MTSDRRPQGWALPVPVAVFCGAGNVNTAALSLRLRAFA